MDHAWAKRARCGSGYWFRRYSALDCQSCGGSRRDASIDAVDQQASTIEIAQKLSADYPAIHFHKADVFEFGDAGSYDIVLCSLALHHFTEEDAIRLLKHCRELTRRYVLVSDLRRGLFTSVGVYLLTAVLFRDPMTRYDGRVSAARAFSFRELHALAQRADWKNFHHRRFRYARQAIWLDLLETLDGDLYHNARSATLGAREQKTTRSCSDDGRTASRSYGVDPNRARGSGRRGRSRGEYFCEPVAI